MAKGLEKATKWALAQREMANDTLKRIQKSERMLERSKRRNKACRKATSCAKAGRLTQTMSIRSDASSGRLCVLNMDSRGKRKAIDEQWVRQDASYKCRKGKDNYLGGIEYTTSSDTVMKYVEMAMSLLLFSKVPRVSERFHSSIYRWQEFWTTPCTQQQQH